MTKTEQPSLDGDRPQWRSHLGFILAAIGSAIGLGNIWRFSYLCYKNGGGAFLIPYLIALAVVGIPLMILELAIGHRMRGSAPLSFAKISRTWEWCGWWPVLLSMLGIILYYSVIIAWCLSYAVFSLDLSWGDDPNNFFFRQYLQISDSPFDIESLRSVIMLSLAAVWIMAWLIVFLGVQNGVERANRIFMPLLLVLTIILVVWSLSLEGASAGLAVYLQPDFALLKHPQVWIDAFSQIFFTLSLGFGIMINYASYLPKRVDLIKDATLICIGNCAFSFLAGFAVFGTLGYMAHVKQVPVTEVVTESIGLAFVTYPQAIGLLPTFASLFGVMFFGALLIAGLSSAISLIEALVSAVTDKFNFQRQMVLTVTCVIGFLGSIIFCARSGLYWIDIADHFITHYGLVMVGIIECVILGWLFGTKRICKHVFIVSERKLSVLWELAIRLIVPLVLVLILVHDLISELKISYGGYSREAVFLIGINWVLLTFIISLVVAQVPWYSRIFPKSKDRS